MFGRIVVRVADSLIALAIAQLFMGFAILVRLLPAIALGALALFRITLILSFRLYRLILNRVGPFIARSGIEITSGLWRAISTVGLSLVIGSALWLLLGWHLGLWVVGLLTIHGLIVGLAWDEIEKPGGLQMGVRIE